MHWEDQNVEMITIQLPTLVSFLRTPYSSDLVLAQPISYISFQVLSASCVDSDT